MSNTTEMTASPRLRAMFVVGAATMLALWGWSLVPPIENWSNPNEDGFSYVGVFYTTLICLPVGLCLLIGAIAGRGGSVSRARVAFYIAAGVTVLVAAFLIVQHIADNKMEKFLAFRSGSALIARMRAQRETNVHDPPGVKTYRLPCPALTCDSGRVADILHAGDDVTMRKRNQSLVTASDRSKSGRGTGLFFPGG
jgi:hypothetical protein